MESELRDRIIAVIIKAVVCGSISENFDPRDYADQIIAICKKYKIIGG